MNFFQRLNPCLVLSLAALSMLLSGCNLFSPLSSPTGDDQLISACRADFDNGDFQDALNCYSQVSSVNQDIQISESDYVRLAQQAASMANYAAAFGKGNVSIGPAITKFAEGMIPGAGLTRRLALFQIYSASSSQAGTTQFQLLGQINPNLQYLVDFLASLSFAAEILAEEGSYDSNGNPILTQADLNTFQLTGSPTSALAQLTVSQVSASPGNYDLLNCALLEIANAVGNLHTSGTFGSSTVSFTQEFQPYLGQSGTIQTAIYVQALIAAGVGEANQ